MEKKQLTLVVVSLLVVVLSVSVAYFTAQIIGEGKEVSVTSANLQIIFKDEDGTIADTSIEPGWTSTKTFTVKNSTKSEYKYNIVLKDLVNTFVTEGYLQYKITSTNSGYNMTEFKDVPKSATATDTILAYNVSVPVGTTQTYTIEFKYSNDENVDQSKDMGKTLSGKIFIEKSIPTLANKLLEDNPTISTRNNFSTPFTTNTASTLYKATENGRDVYYFSGTENNSTGKCTYNGNGFKDPSGDFINLSKEKCLSQMTLCVLSDYNRTEFPSEELCTDTLGGQVITITNADWEETLNTAPSINNWVKFGGFYWRIIRTNADGGIRLLYHGTSHDSTTAYITTSAFNSSTYKDSMYVGYMYGTSGSPENNRTNTNNSTIKTVIDSWYANNLTNYTKYLSTTAIYCNDREVGSGTYSATGSTFYYKGYTRLNTNKTPTYDCTNTSDAFSVSNTSAKLTYPIGLMTADEVSFAGGIYENNAPAYYYYNSAGNSSTDSYSWYTMSPFDWGGSNAGVFYVSGSYYPGSLGGTNVNSTIGVRPVISLKFCIKYGTGDGSANSPYTIDETSSEC